MTKIEKKVILFNIFVDEAHYFSNEVVSYGKERWSGSKKLPIRGETIWKLYCEMAKANRGHVDPDMVDAKLAVCKAAVKAGKLKLKAENLTKYDLEAVLEEWGIIIEDDI